MAKLISLCKKIWIKVLILFSDQYSVANVYRKYYHVKIGNNVRFTGEPSWGSEPYLIKIGDNVTITQNVIFHTHDGGVGLFRDEYPGINLMGKISIGNNVFVGSRSTFLPNVRVGNNVIIGSGSVISRDIPSNCVAVGVPAKPIKSIEEYKISALKKAIYINKSNDQERMKEVIQKLNFK